MPDEDDDTDLSSTIATNAQGPAEARGDSSSIRQHSLTDQIQADRYLRTKAAQRSSGLGLVFRRITPPGAEG